MGGSRIKAVVLDETGQVLDSEGRPTPGDPDAILDVAAGLAGSLAPGRPVGLALAGLVDHRKGVLRWAPHLPGTDVPYRSELADRLDVPVLVENDANAAAVGEARLGSGAGSRFMVMLTLGTGIGMGIIDEGRLVRGRAHAGEVGHVTVDRDGSPCACGRTGCWETRVSGRRFEAEAFRVLGPSATAPDLVEAARRGHQAALDSVSDAAGWLARGIEALALVLDPEVIVVGGAASAAGDILLDPARRLLESTEGAGHRTVTRVEAGILGSDAGAVGAALLVAEETGS